MASEKRAAAIESWRSRDGIYLVSERETTEEERNRAGSRRLRRNQEASDSGIKFVWAWVCGQVLEPGRDRAHSEQNRRKPARKKPTRKKPKRTSDSEIVLVGERVATPRPKKTRNMNQDMRQAGCSKTPNQQGACSEGWDDVASDPAESSSSSAADGEDEDYNPDSEESE